MYASIKVHKNVCMFTSRVNNSTLPTIINSCLHDVPLASQALIYLWLHGGNPNAYHVLLKTVH